MEKAEFLYTQSEVYDEIISGLQNDQKTLPCKLFYDEEGSILFDQITELREYYPTRTEAKIITDNIDEITSVFENNTLFIEFGSGSSSKTRLLLSKLKNLAGYIPIDISEEHLKKSAESLRNDYPALNVIPVVADYTDHIDFPEIHHKIEHKITFFPGSTIGNFSPEEAKDFLKLIARECGKNGGLLIGVDLKKDPDVLHDAYNDSKGITAKFNMNILTHLNNEYGFDFNMSKFEHYAFYNQKAGRIEMHLRSLANQVVSSGTNAFMMKKGETILTEYSYKYSIDDFVKLASESFVSEKVWTDSKNYFSIHFFKVK